MFQIRVSPLSLCHSPFSKYRNKYLEKYFNISIEYMRNSKQCQVCSTTDNNVPLLVCGHFICPQCYVKMKTEDKNCKCVDCNTRLKRKTRKI